MGPVPDAPTTTASPPPLRLRRSIDVSALRVPVLLALALTVAVGGYYLLYVTQVRSYLVGRNFRLLASMSDRIEAAIVSEQRILGNFRGELKRPGVDADEAKAGRELASNFIPLLRWAEFKNRSEKGVAVPENVALLLLGRQPPTRWMVLDGPNESPESLFLEVRLEGLLRELLHSQVNEKTFEVLMVAARDGRVLAKVGGPALRIADIAQLTATSAKSEGRPAFDQLARSSGVVDIVVSGTEYKLFTQPCCGMVTEEKALPTAAPGWVVCGLTRKSELASASYSVPLPLLGILAPVLLLAVLSWPFVKLSLIGDTQRVTAYDAALVGICALVGTALVTLCALDLYAASAIHGRLDEQLRMLAEDIQKQVTEEIGAASRQLDRLTEAVADNRLPSTEKVRDLAGINPSVGKPFLADDELRRYPFFESFALIGEDGKQKRKMSVGTFVTSLIPVHYREYFRHWRTRADGPAMLDPIQSRTTDLREAILSKPATGTPFKVAALAIPMRTLINPVVPTGFGFVVINDDGAVLFHSDPQHSLSEDFFIESDNNRRLRALVAARRTEWLDVKYWGDDHRAFVSPLTLPTDQVTLVTLYDKEVARALHVEWLVLVLVFVLVYAGMYAGGAVLVLIARPRYRAPWLWPDPRGSRKYLDLLPALLGLIAAFLIAIVTLAPADLLMLAWLLPLLAWAVAYFVLREHAGWRRLGWPALLIAGLLVPLLLLVSRADQPAWRSALVLLLAGSALHAAVTVRRRERPGRTALAPPPNLCYGMVAVGLLILVGVLPAMAFFRVGYDMHIETLVKHGQLEVAQARHERSEGDRESLAAQVPPGASAKRLALLRDERTEWGAYESFFFSTTRADGAATGCDGLAALSSPALTVDRDALPDLVEELLPFYSEGSVRFRELTHDRTSDRSWQWFHDGRQLVFCSDRFRQASLRSTVPGLFDWPHRWPGLELHLFWVILGSAAVLIAAIWIVRFIVYNVFVADVIEPVWTGSDDVRRDAWGPHLFLISPASGAPRVPSGAYCEIDLEQAPPQAGTWFDEQAARVQQAPAAQGVLVLHFEHRLEDAAFNREKLDFIQRIVKVMNRTVVVLSAVPPSTVTETDVESTLRWAEVLSLFTIVPVTPARPAPPESIPVAPLADWATSGWREIVWRMNALGFAHAVKFLDSERGDPEVSRLWKQVLPYAWHPEQTPLEVGQLLVEVGERAETHYREIWSACAPAERLALGHIAEEGLVNRRMKATVRRLMARGLVRREPHFVVMNETFRRFVLTVSSNAESTALEETASNPWEAIRLPFLAVLVASLTFLFVTQHELFTTTVAVVTGVGGAVPAIMKMASLFGHQRPT